ncbi:MAG TPA: hypothetical protein VJI46_03220 [Candidatus Nanoarchaeia archaeon]|nr:hypothetical protein [Candidatus Nanoarchaeia archaeon]
MKQLTIPLTFALSLPPALAQSAVGDAGRKIYDILSPVFSASLGSQYGDFYLKALLFFLVYAILFYVLQFVFKEEKGKRIRIIVALIISLIAVIGIPSSIVRGIALSYMITVVFFLIVLPIFAIVMLNTKVFHEANRTNYIAKMMLFALLAWLIGNIMHIGMPENIDTMSLQSWLGFAQSVVIILAVWSGFMALFTGPAAEHGEGEHPASRFWDWIARRPTPAAGHPAGAHPVPGPHAAGATGLTRLIGQFRAEYVRFDSSSRNYISIARQLLRDNHQNVTNARGTPGTNHPAGYNDPVLHPRHAQLIQTGNQIEAQIANLVNHVNAIVNHPNLGEVDRAELDAFIRTEAEFGQLAANFLAFRQQCIANYEQGQEAPRFPP